MVKIKKGKKLTKKRVCKSGWSCGMSCISRKKACKKNLTNAAGKAIAEKYADYVKRLAGSGAGGSGEKPVEKPKYDEDSQTLTIDGKQIKVRPGPWAKGELTTMTPEELAKAINSIDKDGEIRGRKAGVREYLSDPKTNQMAATEVFINKNGEMSIKDGRHRAKLLEEMGIKNIPVTVEREPAPKAAPEPAPKAEKKVFTSGETADYKRTREEMGIVWRQAIGEENLKLVEQELQNRIKDRVPVVYINKETIDLIRSQEEQRLKNQFETNTSGGLLNKQARVIGEDQRLGVPSDTPGTQRPIYTGFQDPSKGFDNRYRNYGDQAYKINGLTEKDYTFTFDDSLQQGTFVAVGSKSGDLSSAMPLDEFVLDMVVPNYTDGKTKMTKEEVTNMVEEIVENNYYMEAQIYTNVTLDMLELIGEES